MKTGFGTALGISLLLAKTSLASLCQSYAEPMVLGELKANGLDEASGIVFSQYYEKRAYHLNDSGFEKILYVSHWDGSNAKRLEIENFLPLDTEDLSLGTYQDKPSVLNLGDIGDNLKIRPFIRVALLEEPKKI